MMKQFLKALAISFIALPCFASVNVGEPAPDFTLTDSNGKTHTLAEFKGKNVVLEWTNHDCPFVKKHYESDNMQNLQKKYTEQDVVWLSIISSAKGKQGFVSGEKANDLTKTRNAHPSFVLFDTNGSTGKIYGAKTTPHMYIIDKEGKLIYKGGIDSIQSANKDDIAKATNYVDKALTEHLAGKPVSETNTAFYGCSIKY
jgi:peroxiredoxin